MEPIERRHSVTMASELRPQWLLPHGGGGHGTFRMVVVAALRAGALEGADGTEGWCGG